MLEVEGGVDHYLPVVSSEARRSLLPWGPLLEVNAEAVATWLCSCGDFARHYWSSSGQRQNLWSDPGWNPPDAGVGAGRAVLWLRVNLAKPEWLCQVWSPPLTS